MSVMDPLLNLGVLWRCLAAYTGIDYKKETERFKSILDLPDNGKTIDNNKVALRNSPSIASIIKTTPFKTFLSRSSTQSPLSTKSPPKSPTATNSEFNIRYSKRESFDFGPVTTEELVNIESPIRSDGTTQDDGNTETQKGNDE